MAAHHKAICLKSYIPLRKVLYFPFNLAWMFPDMSMINALGQNARCLLSPFMQLTIYRRLVCAIRLLYIWGKGKSLFYAPQSTLADPYKLVSRGWFCRLWSGKKICIFVFRKVLSPPRVTRFPFGSRLFNLTHFMLNPALDTCPPLPLSSLSFGLCDPLSPGLERPSLPILDNCESLLIGLQRKRITWAHNDVMARGPSPPPSPPPLKPNPHQPQMSLKPTAWLSAARHACLHASGQTYCSCSQI